MLKSFLRSSGFLFSLTLVLYLSLVLPTLSRQGISWDEQTDLEIARAYLTPPDGWLAGSPLDASQTRLSHAVVAAVFWLTQRSDLLTARWISVLVGLLTLFGVYRYCCLRSAAPAGVLACGLLAASPFYLSFARVAFTETDIYVACVFIWLLVSLERMSVQPTFGRIAWVGVLLGLGLSAKFTALAIFPAVAYAVFQKQRNPAAPHWPLVKLWQIGMLSALSLLITTLCLILANTRLMGASLSSTRLILFLILGGTWLAVIVWVVCHRAQTTSRLMSGVFVVSVAFLSFLVFPPDHLTNPAILRALLDRFNHEMTYKLAFIPEAAGVHILSILFKSSPIIGAGLLISWIWTTLEWRRTDLRVPILLSVGYLAGLLLLPLAQTFYIIPILPILSIFAAQLFLRIMERLRLIAVGIIICAAVLLVVDLVQCYPDYNLNGYQYLGPVNILGRSSIGYRSIVQTPSDGVEQVILWLNTHAQTGDRVLSYVLETHIIRALAPSPVYRILDGLQSKIPPSADYVVTEINTMVPQSWWTPNLSGAVFRPPFDPTWLESGYTRVFSVDRAFGIEAAVVWQKKR